MVKGLILCTFWICKNLGAKALPSHPNNVVIYNKSAVNNPEI